MDKEDLVYINEFVKIAQNALEKHGEFLASQVETRIQILNAIEAAKVANDTIIKSLATANREDHKALRKMIYNVLEVVNDLESGNVEIKLEIGKLKGKIELQDKDIKAMAGDVTSVKKSIDSMGDKKDKLYLKLTVIWGSMTAAGLIIAGVLHAIFSKD